MTNARWTPLLALLALLLTACPSPGTQAKGQLEVTVTIPAGSGISPNVLVTGPGGFTQTISQDGVRLFDQAAVGDYTITAQDVIAGGTTYTGTVSVGSNPGTSNSATATVTANSKTTATVAYAAALSGLQVNVSNLPANTQRVIVRARASDGTTTEDTSLTGNGTVNLDVPNGTYSVQVLAVVGTSSTVASSLESFLTSATAPAVVDANTFTSRPATGRLYLAIFDTTSPATASGVAYLSDAQLQGSSTPVPSSQLRLEPSVLRVAFDRQGNLFELKQGSSAASSQTLIKRYAPSTAQNNAFSPVDFVITNGYFTLPACSSPPCQDRNLTSPTALAFDASGNLWLADPTSVARIDSKGGSIPASAPAGRLVCFSAADMAAKVGATPNTLGTPGVIYYGAAVAGATSLAFDGSGNLWIGASVITPSAARRLTRIPSSSLSCPNLNPDTETPQTLQLASGDRNYTVTSSVGEPTDLALDPSGNSIWVANRTGNNLLEFSTASTSTTPSPLKTVTVTGQPSLAPRSLAFDARGRLWVGGGSALFSLPAISSSGAVAADKSFSASFPVTSLAFNLGEASTPPFLQ